MTLLNIVGLDASETKSALVHFFGEAGSLPDKEPGNVSVEFIGTAKKDHVDRGDRLIWYREQYVEYFKRKHSILAGYNVVCLEGYSFGSKYSAQHAGELGGIVRLAALDAGWTLVLAAPTTLKRLTTGKGNAAKEVMLRDVMDKWGFKAKDNNDCDAYALFRLGYLWCLTCEFDPALTKKSDAIVAELEMWRAR